MSKNKLQHLIRINIIHRECFRFDGTIEKWTILQVKINLEKKNKILKKLQKIKFKKLYLVYLNLSNSKPNDKSVVRGGKLFCLVCYSLKVIHYCESK